MTVLFLDVSRPQFITAEIEAFQDSVSRHDTDVFSIRNRRRGRHILLAHLSVATAERLLPKNTSFSLLNTPKREFITLGDIEEDAIFPDDGRGAAPTGQSQLPLNVLRRAPAKWKVLLVAHPIEIGSAPLGPVSPQA